MAKKSHNRVFIEVPQSDLEILADFKEIKLDSLGRAKGLGDFISRAARQLVKEGK